MRRRAGGARRCSGAPPARRSLSCCRRQEVGDGVVTLGAALAGAGHGWGGFLWPCGPAARGCSGARSHARPGAAPHLAGHGKSRRDTASPGGSSGPAGPHGALRRRALGPGLSSSLLPAAGLPSAAALRAPLFLLALPAGPGLPSRQPHGGAGLGGSAGGRGGRSSWRGRLVPAPGRQERRWRVGQPSRAIPRARGAAAPPPPSLLPSLRRAPSALPPFPGLIPDSGKGRLGLQERRWIAWSPRRGR